MNMRKGSLTGLLSTTKTASVTHPFGWAPTFWPHPHWVRTTSAHNPDFASH